MSICPYTFVRDLFGFKTKLNDKEATYLRVTVARDNEVKVDVSMPARSARWLIDLIPEDVVKKIREEQVPLDAIQAELAASEVLVPQKIFTLNEPNRIVQVWLE